MRATSYWLCAAALSLAGACGGETSPDDGGTPDASAPDASSLDGMVATGRCGDGEQTAGEECDDGNRQDDDGCARDCTLECGNGVLNEGELCDPEIAAGDPGACPTGCDDGDACTTDVVSGTDCSVQCESAPISAPSDGDGCCPPGADATTDDDCTSICGNSIVEPGETCDTAIAEGMAGACPASCDDGDFCTADSVAMDGTCAAACEFTPITVAADGDMCCPPGETIATDNDCGIVCGDGVRSMGESCDTAIPAGSAGACPTSCDDGMVCTTDMLASAGTCDAQCTSTVITTPMDGDGCCPAGATIADDDDCTATCGDGVVSSGESCDTAIAAGMPGACPSTCSDGMACTQDTLTGAGTCSATCSFPPITSPADGDGCCPAGATIATDNDCPARCGDGVVSAGETCDTAISGGAGACPASCDDGDPCTTDSLANGGTCRAACTTMPVGAGPMDMCCPAGADLSTDPDCAAACGDGVTTPPETCDDGNTMSGDGCDSMCRAEPTAFRFTDLDIRDPHVFADLGGFFGCTDVTNGPFGMGINNQLQDSIQQDSSGSMSGGPDGDLDLSIVHAFAPLLQSAGSSTPSYLVFPDCTAPMSSTMCTLPMGAPRTPGTAMNQGGGAECLGVLPGTARPYTPTTATPVAPPGGTCYAANAGTVTFDLSGIMITLEDARIGGQWFGTPATEIRNGLIRGFLSEAQANSTIIPPGTTGQPAIDGQPLSSLLRGGVGSCSEPSPMMGDKDTYMGMSGWYFYLNFSATRVPYTEL